MPLNSTLTCPIYGKKRTMPWENSFDFENQFSTRSHQFTMCSRNVCCANFTTQKYGGALRAPIYSDSKIGANNVVNWRQNVVNWRERVVNWFSKSKLFFPGVGWGDKKCKICMKYKGIDREIMETLSSVVQRLTIPDSQISLSWNRFSTDSLSHLLKTLYYSYCSNLFSK